MHMVSFFFSIVGVLLGVAFFTLFERKTMSLMHYRKGPNKVMIAGLTQPMADAAKLLTKESMKVTSMKKILYIGGPLLALTLMMLCWIAYNPAFSGISNTTSPIFMVLSVMGLSSFVFLMCGWGSNTKYALLGSYRTISQIISYEVCLMLMVLCVVYVCRSMSHIEMKIIQQMFPVWALNLPFFFTWLMVCLSESSRTPFDHAESESELVSGFNVEYGGGMFALIFIAEYGMIIVMSFITAYYFLGASMVLAKTFLVCMFYVWARCSFPRLRYDKLMYMCWKMCVPYSLMVICCCVM